ncbi:MAG: phosphodiester glycosidase family protein, partial [Bacteroidales bacterium]|nr:phosphodiester glycosidase family protein [Bacteroidales bacterium]
MNRKTLILSLVILFVTRCWIGFAAPAPGNGWKVENIADGVVYYTFSGIDEISGVAQQVFVIDLDLNNPKYALRFSYSNPEVPTSDVFLRNDAIAAVNAAYEPSSVVIKVNGTLYSDMPYNTVFHDPVPNWKSEGAVYTDGFRDVRISFDGKGKSIKQQREFYKSRHDLNILTSAPMLIDNFDPVGERFVNPSLTKEDILKLEYEDPARHQGVRHPRTAVAKTEDNHLILLCVDGRRAGIGEGMSAKELTLFLVKHFNPQYALNMDGGGS